MPPHGFATDSHAKNAFVIVFDGKPDWEKKAAKKRRPRTNNAQFAFINLTDSGKYTPEARRRIRTHVMSDYWRKYIAETPKTQLQRVDRQDLNYLPNPIASSTYPPQLCPQPLGGFDPFFSLPIQMQPFMYPILYQYASDFIHEPCLRTREHENNLPQCPMSIWLSKGFNDEAIFRAVLCMAAFYTDATAGQKPSTRSCILKGDATRIISERLSDTESSVSDGTITAVTFLAIEEGIARNVINWTSHMRGLKQMVELRGGLSKLDPQLEFLIYIADLFGCHELSFSSYFYWPKPTGRHQITYPLPAPDVWKDFRWISAIKVFDDNLLAIFSVVRILTAMLNQATKGDTEVNPLVTGAAMNWIRAMTRIRSRILISSVTGEESERKSTNELCCLGIQIYLTTVVDKSFGREVGLFDLSLKLRNLLDDLDIETVACPHLWLWAALFGGIVARDNKERSWFVARVREVAEFLNLCSWHSIPLTLTSFLWVEILHDEPGRQIWNAAVTNSRL